MAYEKAEFYANYRVYAVDPVTRHRFAKFKSPDIAGGQEMTLVLHYHPAAIKPTKAALAARLIQHFIDQGVPLTVADRICVIGGAYNWLGEALEDAIPGMEVCSVDLSQYVQDTKDSSPDDEVIEELTANGYAIDDGGPGQYLYDKFKDPNPRSRDGGKVLQEDLGSPQSRNEVRKALKNANPTRVITEDVWQILDQTEQDRYTAAAANWGVTLTHIIGEVII